jgi:CubicO group peptidase (beta-lactamase class C family)
MKRLSLLCSLIFGFSLTKVPAQDSAIIETITHWRGVEDAIVLLRNESSLLPLKKLETWRPGSLTFYEVPVFEETLRKYSVFSTPPQRPTKNDLVVVALDAAEYSPVNPAFREFEQQVDTLVRRAKVVAVLFGNPEIIARLPSFRQAEALLLVPGVDEPSQSLAAQVIFGGVEAKGRLEQPIGNFFKKGDGLDTPGNLRLRYSPSERVGMNGQLLADSIAAIVQEGILAHAYPGAQVLVAKDGHVVFHQAYGYHTYDSLQALRTTDIYDFASVTKVTTTLPALMKLYGEGKFDPDAPLKRYFRFFKKSNKSDLTFRSMLAHNARLKPGIVFWRQAQDDNGNWKRRTFKTCYSKRYPIRITDSLFLFKKYPKKMYAGIRAQPLEEKPGYVYSDLSFILYPKVVERLTGQRLEGYLGTNFYRPLGANTLAYNPLRIFPKERIVPTERDTFFRKMQVQGTVHDENAAMLGGVSGHAGLFGSANDLAKLFQMYLNGGVYGGERFIAESALAEFTRCQYCAEGNRRSLGFDKPLIDYDPASSYVAKSASSASFGHSGYTGTFVWADPESKLLVIFFSNRVYPDRSSRGLYDLNIRARVQEAAYQAMRR